MLESAIMPLLTIGDYALSEYNTKYEGYEFNWKLSIYTEYEGKKQVNELVSKSIKSLYEIKNQALNDMYCIDDVMLNEANINRIDGFYVANLSMRIEIN